MHCLIFLFLFKMTPFMYNDSSWSIYGDQCTQMHKSMHNTWSSSTCMMHGDDDHWEPYLKDTDAWVLEIMLKSNFIWRSKWAIKFHCATCCTPPCSQWICPSTPWRWTRRILKIVPMDSQRKIGLETCVIGTIVCWLIGGLEISWYFPIASIVI